MWPVSWWDYLRHRNGCWKVQQLPNGNIRWKKDKLPLETTQSGKARHLFFFFHNVSRMQGHLKSGPIFVTGQIHYWEVARDRVDIVDIGSGCVVQFVVGKVYGMLVWCVVPIDNEIDLEWPSYILYFNLITRTTTNK